MRVRPNIRIGARGRRRPWLLGAAAALAATIAFGAALPAPGLAAPGLAVEFGVSALTIESGEDTHSFRVEIARTRAERGLGLMYRTRLGPDAGMLFDYRTPRPVAMWMKNTLIPLDMLFIDSRGRIVKIAARTVPGSTAAVSSGKPVRAVLEINGGTAQRLGIAVGDLVRHPIFSPRATARDKP